MLGNLKNMFKGSAKAKPSVKNSAPKAEAPAPAAPAKVEAPAPKAEKPAAKKESNGGFNLLGILDNKGNGNKAAKASKPAPVNRQSTGPNEFFLNADDAKTFGDIDYMRTAKSIRKSFPKAPGKTEGTEIEVTVSNLVEEKGETSDKPTETVSSGFGSQPSFTPNAKVKTDTSMDMFRNMAKGIGKR